MSDNLSLAGFVKMTENLLKRDSERFGFVLALFALFSSFPESVEELPESFES